MPTSTETRKFEAETKQLLDLMIHSLYTDKDIFLRDLQRLLPEIRNEDLAPGGSGVRAQAVASNGALLDDFNIIRGREAVHVLNAPSPGATSSLAIGEHIVELAAEAFGFPE